jgi:HD superfamily phosphodiesterase
MESVWQKALPFLDTRQNQVHTEIALSLARQLLAAEGGDPAIVIPAVMLHDVGWKLVPESLQMTAFGPGATDPGLNRRHEVEGARIAGDILRQSGYPEKQTAQIVAIIDGHDSRREAISHNDRIVKDADRLWRYTRTGFHIDIARFGETHAEGIERLRANLAAWLFTDTARKLAVEKIRRRQAEGKA